MGLTVDEANRVVLFADGYRSRLPEETAGTRYTLLYETLSPWEMVRGSDFAKAARDVFDRIVRRPLEQAVGRFRGINSPKTIILLSAHEPTGVPAYHDYVVDPDWLSDRETVHHVVDSKIRDQIEGLLWNTAYSHRKVAAATGMDRKTVAKMGPTEARSRRIWAKEIVRLRGEGKTWREVAEEMPRMSKDRARRIYKSLPSQSPPKEGTKVQRRRAGTGNQHPSV